MRGLKLAFSALSRHLWRTILTVLLFSVALGTFTFVLSPLMFDAPNHYLNVLAKNDVKAILIESTERTNPEETVKKYLPANHRIFKVQEGSSGGMGFMFDIDSNLNQRRASLFGMESSDFEDMGYGLEFGEYPKSGEYAISLALFERLKQEGLTQIYDDNGETSTRAFSTFEELKNLFKLQKRRDVYQNTVVPNPVLLSGVVDTKYNEKKEAELKAAVHNAEKKDSEAAKNKLYSYTSQYGNLYVFAHDTANQFNEEGTKFLTSLPKDAKDKKALFQKIQTKERSRLNIFSNGKEVSDLITIQEERYDEEFYNVVGVGYTASMLVLPVAILFLILSLFMMLNLASVCGKSSSAEIGEQQARGMKSREVYGVALIRSVFVALVSFVVSVGFAYLCRFVFTTGGIVDSVLSKAVVGWDSAGRNMGDFNHFGFLPFFTALMYGLSVAFLGSFIGYRKSRKKQRDAEEDVENLE